MGVRYMKKVRCISEIILALILIFVSYFAWDRIDVEAYEKSITQYNENHIVLEIEHKFDTLAFLRDKDSVENTVVFVNNYQNKVYNFDLLLELNGIDENIMNNLFLSVDDEIYSLNDILIDKNLDTYTFLIKNVCLSNYEKEDYKVKLLIDDSFNVDELNTFSYNIREEIYG